MQWVDSLLEIVGRNLISFDSFVVSLYLTFRDLLV